MNLNDRELINSRGEELVKLIEFNSNLVNQMINKNIFTQPMIDDIQRIKDPTQRKKRFLTDLTRRGPQACDQLVEILYGIGQESAAKVLRPASFLATLNREQVIEMITSPLSPPVDASTTSTTNPFIRSGQEASAVGNKTVAEIEMDRLMSVQTCKKAMTGENIYQMASYPRGFCLLFDNHIFDSEAWPERKGSAIDAQRLSDIFTQLHFIVKKFENSSKDTIIATMKSFAKNPDLKKHDAIVVIVLSHGQREYVITSDGLGVNFEDIIKQFNNENCPQLINRPKLFFFNCCRGEIRDSGPKKYSEGEDAASDAKAINDMLSVTPTANDMMICYSTVDGYVSWRNPMNGSWFCTALSQALMKHSHDKELHHILTLASSNVTNRRTLDGCTQVMEHVFRGWSKLFYFNPGIPPNSATDSSATPSDDNSAQ